MASENRKKLDNRIRVLIENCVQTNHRSFFVIVGEKAKSQIPILYHMLTKSTPGIKPSVLWCYKKDLGFSTHQKKRMRLLQKKKQFGGVINEDNPFEMFISSTQISYCYYKESERILGNTYGMLVLQDFEAITPNLLARTIETVQGGGIVTILLNTVDSLQQLYALSMDVHSRYRTEAHQDVTPRFNERFILSLSSCGDCLVIDDQLNVLPISSATADIKPLPKPEDIDELTSKQLELEEAKKSLLDKQPLGSLASLCKTIDQLNALVNFVNSLQEKTLKSTVSLTAGRGRGKSATLGMAIAAAIGYHYSNIYITSPSPENLRTLFEFVLKGFEAINLKQHMDYEILYSSEENHSKTIVRINVFREHRQTIQYVNPVEVAKNRLVCQAAELVVIDEAAAIPLPIVKSFFGPYLVFLSSTINGYEGTGRSLSLKLLNQLRQQTAAAPIANGDALSNNPFGRRLLELTLDESIRYSPEDCVEKWLNHLLCLDANLMDKLSSVNLPLPQDCDLYYINRDTLFSYHKVSETFLQRLVALYAASHYKNSPNDLQMMSDAPAHHLFCLLPPIREDKLNKPGSISGKIPEILCFIQVALEGQISSQSIMNNLARGQRSSGDLIPWTISQQFQEDNFAQLSGARIVRIATNPNCNNKGYGTRALKLLEEYYKGLHSFDLNEDFNSVNKNDENQMNVDQDNNSDDMVVKKRPKKSLPPLLCKLNQRKAEKLDYLGTSFGLTSELLKFWKKNGFVPLYLRQTANELTGEHSCIMVKLIDQNDQSESNVKNWLTDFYFDFRKRFINLLGYQFREFKASLALSVLQNENIQIDSLINEITKNELESHLSLYDLKRLEKYSQNLIDYHLIMDLLPSVAKLYFQRKFSSDISLSLVQSFILLSIGLQHKSVDLISQELNLPESQVLGLFIRAIARITKYLRKVEENAIEEQLGLAKAVTVDMNPLKQSLQDELAEAADDLNDVNDADKSNNQLNLGDLSQYSIKGSEDDWNKMLKGKTTSFLKVETLKRKSQNSFGGKKSAKKPFHNKNAKKMKK